MSTIRANTITNSAGSGAPDFPNGITAATIPAANLTGTVTSATLPAENLTGNVAAARIATALNATGSAPIFACRAWVNFNGIGTVAIRASGNISSITDNGVGNYTLNFTTAMPDANYSAAGNGGDSGGATSRTPYVSDKTTTTCRVTTNVISSGAPTDPFNCDIIIFR